jgi:hypothetical protein
MMLIKTFNTKDTRDTKEESLTLLFKYSPQRK